MFICTDSLLEGNLIVPGLLALAKQAALAAPCPQQHSLIILTDPPCTWPKASQPFIKHFSFSPNSIIFFPLRIVLQPHILTVAMSALPLPNWGSVLAPLQLHSSIQSIHLRAWQAWFFIIIIFKIYIHIFIFFPCLFYAVSKGQEETEVTDFFFSRMKNKTRTLLQPINRAL